jgi:hypothetical protein
MDKRQVRAFEGFAAESGAELLRIATLLTADPPGVRVDASAHDLAGRPAVKTSWTGSDKTVYSAYAPIAPIGPARGHRCSVTRAVA